MTDIRQSNHTHISTRSIVGGEFTNVIYENDIDASLAYLGLIQEFSRDNPEPVELMIEDVVRSMHGDSNGMYFGTPGYILMISSCEGGCISPSWN